MSGSRRFALIYALVIVAGLSVAAVADPDTTNLQLWYQPGAENFVQADFEEVPGPGGIGTCMVAIPGGPITDGGPIYSWTDSHNGVDAVSGASMLDQPRWRDNQVNGQAAIRMGPEMVDDELRAKVQNMTVPADPSLSLDTDEMTVFVVSRFDVANRYDSHDPSITDDSVGILSGVHLFGSGVGATWGLGWYEEDNSFRGFAVDAAGDPVYSSAGADSGDDQWHVLALNWAADDTVTLWFDGVEMAAGAGADATPSFFDGLSIGGLTPNAWHDFWTGDISEILVYGDDLDALTHNDTGYYLETKYGLDTAYTPEPAGLTLLAAGALAILRRRKTARI